LMTTQVTKLRDTYSTNSWTTETRNCK
jgi:hypothetical protein